MQNLRTHIPRLVRMGVALPKAGARETLVLSRVNGVFSVAEIASFVGMPFEEALTILQGFALRGVVELLPPSAAGALRDPNASPQDRASSRPSIPMAPRKTLKGDPDGPPSGMYSVVDEDSARSRSMRPPSAPQQPAVPSAPAVKPGIARTTGGAHPDDEFIDLDPARRQEIEQAYLRLEGANHYEVLGVHPTSPKATVRTAYFDLSKRFHPDALYGKRLGSLKGKMEAVFKRVTEAYEVLGKAKRRDEYDRYLNLRAETHYAQESLRRTEEVAEVIESESQARAGAYRPVVTPAGPPTVAPKEGPQAFINAAVTSPPQKPAPVNVNVAVTTPPRPARILTPHQQAKAPPSVQPRPSSPPTVRTSPGTSASPRPMNSVPPAASPRPAATPSQAPPRPSVSPPVYNSGFPPTAAERAMEKLAPSAPPQIMERRSVPPKRSVRPGASKRPARLPSGSGLAAPVGSIKPPVVGAAPAASTPAPNPAKAAAPAAPSTPVAASSAPPQQPAPRVAVHPPGPTRTHTESDADRRRRLMAQQLSQVTGRKMVMPPPRNTGAAGSSVPPGAGTPAAAPPRGRTSLLPPNSVPPERREHLLRDLAKSLKNVAVYTGGVDRAQAHLEDAKRAETKGDLLGAANALRLAVATSPERHDIQLEYDRVSGLLAATLADKYEEQAKMEEGQGSWQEAALSWSKVCDGRPMSAMPHLHAAEAMVKANLPLADAKRLVHRAVELEPENVRALRLLGQIFIGAGMKLNARKTLELAAKLDPKDEVVKNLLKEAK